MSKLIAILVASVMLSGCFGTVPKKEAEIIVKYKYIVTTIPAEMTDVPAPMRKIDPQVSDDAEIANWLIDGEKRAQEVETKLKSIKALQDKRLKELEKLPKEDVIIK